MSAPARPMHALDTTLPNPPVPAAAGTVDPAASTLTLRIEAVLDTRSDAIPDLTAQLAGAVAALLYPHGRKADS